MEFECKYMVLSLEKRYTKHRFSSYLYSKTDSVMAEWGDYLIVTEAIQQEK